MAYIDILLSLVLGLIMFGIGSSLTVSDYRQIFQRPKAVLIGLVLQMVFLPLLGLALLPLTSLTSYYQAGLFILLLCPGGTTSNFISYLVKGDVALSISLTSINSFLILFSIPFFTSVGLPIFLEEQAAITLGFWTTLREVFLVILVPAALGLLFHHRFPVLSEKIESPLKYINVVLLGIVFAIKFFADEQSGGSGLTRDDILLIFPIAFAMHLVALILPFLVGRWANLPFNQNVTIGIEVGLQNTTLALLVTGTMIGNNDMTKPVLVFALFSFFTTTAFAFIARWLTASRRIEKER
jgi:bile acid:Na+ symporter, BASS family